MLLEIGTEEIPARFLLGALDSLRRLAAERLQQARLAYREIKTVGTPRRLALLAFELEPVQADQEEIIVGPPRSTAFGEDGRPTKVALGFARAKGVAVDDLSLLETPKGVYLGLKKKISGRSAYEVLPELLPQLILDLSFPKNMRWGTSTLRFARPIHWIAALYGAEVIPFSLEGIPSGRQTFGHRFMAPGPLSLAQAGEYAERLLSGKVVVDPEERRSILTRELEFQATKAGGRVRIDPQLLDEVTNLVEWPSPVTDKFDPDFLKLRLSPGDLHEGAPCYFPLVDEQETSLNRLIAVNNTQVTDEQRVIRGHEVLRARLSDARFFYQEDTKEPLGGKSTGSGELFFIPSWALPMKEVERVTELAAYLSRLLVPGKEALVKRCARLAKADLTSHMVGGVPQPAGRHGPRDLPLPEKPPAAGCLSEIIGRLVGRSPRSDTGTRWLFRRSCSVTRRLLQLNQIPTGLGSIRMPVCLVKPQGVDLIINPGPGIMAFTWKRRWTRAISLYQAFFTLEPSLVKGNLWDFFGLRLEYLLASEGHKKKKSSRPSWPPAGPDLKTRFAFVPGP